MERKFRYYEGTAETIKGNIIDKYSATPDPDGLKTDNMPGYILWMIEGMQNMDRDITSATRAARWMGWILRVVEEDLRLWDNEKSRELIRKDVEKGCDHYR